jgi:hypothetical protein
MLLDVKVLLKATSLLEKNTQVISQNILANSQISKIKSS